MQRAHFRRDVEGLRALAIVAVLLFHSRWSGVFSGGFLGVDVFFVISGFLITGILRTEVGRDGYLLRDFYLRRIRRLYPALFCTVALTLAAGVLLSSPSELLHISQSALASLFSVSNFYFWSQAGYFDVGAIQKPLLHTWSLAVEEQFYLVWPAIVLVLARRMRGGYAAGTLVAMVALGVAAVELALGSNPTSAFYLAPYRVSEFAVGALCAWMPPGHRLKGASLEIVALVGFGLILVPIFLYDGATRFPGLTALVPCAGTALLIGFHGSRTSSVLLANRVAVLIGGLSYSIYLLHWPLGVFLSQWRGEPGVVESLLAIAATLLLAAAMHRFIEQPFRLTAVRGAALSTRRFVGLFSRLTACLVATTILIWYGRGWSSRFSKELTRLGSEAAFEKAARFETYQTRCLSPGALPCDKAAEGPNLFVVGDSHMPDAFNALASQYPQYHYVLHGLDGCPLLAREDYALLTAMHPNRDGCIEMSRQVLYTGKLVSADIIVLSQVFGWYRPEHLGRTIDQIRTRTQAPIVVLGNYLVFGEDVPDMVIRHGQLSMDRYYERRLSTRTFAFDAELRALAAKKEFAYISKRDLLCHGQTAIDCPLMFGQKLFTYDRHHLSVAAARHMGSMLRKNYDQLFGGRGASRSLETSEGPAVPQEKVRPTSSG